MSQRKRILFFESEVGFAGTVKAHFERLGYGVQVVEDGPTGLQVAEEEPPDLILLTIELHGMNGFLACKRIKKSAALAEVPLVILSSEATEDTFAQHQKLRTRAEAYFHKPVPMTALQATVEELIGQADLAAQFISPESQAVAKASYRPSASAGHFAEQAVDSLLFGGGGETPASAPPVPIRTPRPTPPLPPLPSGKSAPRWSPPGREETLEASSAANQPQWPDDTRVEKSAARQAQEQADAEARRQLTLAQEQANQARQALQHLQQETEALRAQVARAQRDAQAAQELAHRNKADADAAWSAVEQARSEASDAQVRALAEAGEAARTTHAAEIAQGAVALSAVQGELEQVRGELAKARAQMAEAEPQRQRLAGLSMELQQVQQERDEAQRQAASAWDRAQEQVKALEAELDQARRALKTAEQTAAVHSGSSRDLLDLRERLNRKDRELLDLRDQIAQRDKEIIEANDRAIGLERELADLNDAHEELRRDATKHRDLVRTLSDERDASRTQLADLGTRLDALQMAKATLEQECSARTAAHAQALRDLQSSHEAEVNEQAQSHRHALTQAEQTLRATEAQHALARERWASDLTAAHQRTEEESERLRATVADANEAAALAAAAHQDELEALRRSHEAELAAATAAVRADLEGRLAAATRAHEDELKALRDALSEQQAESERLRVERDALLEQEQKLDQEVALRGEKMHALTDELDAERQAHAKSNEHFRGEVAELQRTVAQVRQELVDANHRTQSVGERLEETEAARAALASSLSRAEACAAELEETGHGLQAEIDRRQQQAGEQAELLARVRRAMAIGLDLLEQPPLVGDDGDHPRTSL